MAGSTTRDVKLEPIGLGDILSRYHLHVPPNQRNYAWEEDHTGQLFADFSRALNEGGDYFVGSIVTIPRSQSVLEVVDGQQRLATTAILFRLCVTTSPASMRCGRLSRQPEIF